jgi:UTP--glucose-1-phosphate uridylyltransferase
LYFIRQSHPRGLGDAVLTAKSFIGDEPFVVMLGDDLMHDDEPLTKQLIDRYNTTGESTLAVMKVPHDQVSEYGVIAPEKEVADGLHQVNSFVEKPKPEDAPSDLAIIGRYLLTPEIFEELENTKPGKGNEIQLTDAIDTLNKRQHVYAHEFKGDRYDIGSKIGFLTTNIEFGLKHPQTAEALKRYIKDLANKLD